MVFNTVASHIIKCAINKLQTVQSLTLVFWQTTEFWERTST